MPELRRIPSALWLLTGILGLISVLYFPARHVYLMGDDFECLNVVYSGWRNPFLFFRMISLFFRPVLQFLYLLKYTLFGTAAPWHSLILVVIHLLNVSLLYLLLLKLTQNLLIAGVTALLFGTSPRFSEATLWAGGHSDALLAIFLLSLFMVLAETRQRFGVWRKIVIVGSIVGAIGAKETWIILPVLLFGFLTLIRRHTVKQALTFSLPVAIGVLAYLIMFVMLPALRYTASPADYVRPDVKTIIANASSVVFTFSGLKAFFRPSWQHAGLALLLASGLTIITIKLRHRLALWALLWIGLTAGLGLPASVIPSRYYYLPSIGFWILVVTLSAHGLRLAQHRFALSRSVAVGIVSVALACIVPYHALMLRLEISDYQRIGKAHETLVTMYRQIYRAIPVNQPFLVLNAGRQQPLQDMAVSCLGYAKHFYVRPGAFWELIYFVPLANFAGEPFELRMLPLRKDQIEPMLQRDFRILVFTDQGFVFDDSLRDAIRQFYVEHQQLPETTGAYQLVPVTQNDV